MGKKFKKVLSFVAVIAIPFVAPVIASSIGLSAAIGATAGSAVVGAGLGAANAAITGGDVGQGALMGGIGGGIGGYNYTPSVDLSTPTAAFDPVSSSYTNPAALQAASPETYNVATGAYSAPAATAAFDPVSSSYTDLAAQQAVGFSAPPVTTAAAFDPVSSSYTDPAALRAAGFSAPPVTTFDPVSSSYTNPAALQAASPETYNVATGAYSAPPTTFADALKSVPSTIAERFKDPKTLADLTLQAAGQLAGSYFAGDGMSNEEKRLLQAQTDELRKLQESNKALFDQKLQAAQDLIGESKYFDPEYFGLQRARKAQLAGAKAKRAGLRGLTGARRASEERRFDLATGRETGSAFDQGFLGGLSGRMQTAQAGLSGMPGYLTGYGSDYKNIYDQYAAAERRARERSGDIGDLFGTLTGSQKSKQSA